MNIDQFLPTFELGAVGNHSLVARDVLRAAGHSSEIYAAEVHPSCADAGAYRLDEYRGDADVLVYQMAIGSVAGDAVLRQRAPIAVNHHNLTPARYYEGWQPVATYGVAWGRAQLRDLARRAALGIADSAYNARDLDEVGFARSVVVPILVDPASLTVEPDASVVRSDSPTWLFVGRLAPNKAQHDVVKALAAYRKFHDADARLVLVGGGTDDAYGRTLARFVHALGLDDAVVMAGSVTPEQLAGYYDTSDVFVVLSEHEGFCVPLLEAMHHRVPIVAYASSAVPETLADSGIVLTEKNPCVVAAAVARVLGDEGLRTQLVEAGTRRLQAFDLARTGPMFVDAAVSAAR
jgi:glycosyltransferase involved in cell wall biosynthesis